MLRWHYKDALSHGRLLGLSLAWVVLCGPGRDALGQTPKPPTNLRIGAASFPNAQSTGIPAGTVLTPYTGPKVITIATTVIDSKVITGGLEIRAANVLVKNCKISGVGSGEDVIAIATESTGASVTIQDSEIDAGSGPYTGIGDINWTALRVNIYNGHRGVHCYDNCTLQDSYLHDQWAATDGTTHESAARMGQRSRFIHNTLWCNAPISLRTAVALPT
ncbi:MAG: hypothetical protein IPG96_18600 [Proteobacteria bacterium]|nr:hypothetical protein [Pseudomonadota bacterium]